MGVPDAFGEANQMFMIFTRVRGRGIMGMVILSFCDVEGVKETLDMVIGCNSGVVAEEVSWCVLSMNIVVRASGNWRSFFTLCASTTNEVISREDSAMVRP